ncbi:MAG: hypothetical protein MUO35_01520 [Anaerolineales bacterium]|nr:hypothetical protein [Anaerolineales bacterium]
MALYIQRSAKLRIHRPGKPDLVSARPVDRKGNYADTAKPTLIELGPDCAVDPARLLKIGAIEALLEKPKGKEVCYEATS